MDASPSTSLEDTVPWEKEKPLLRYYRLVLSRVTRERGDRQERVELKLGFIINKRVDLEHYLPLFPKPHTSSGPVNVVLASL